MSNSGFDKIIIATARLVGVGPVVTKDLRIVQRGVLDGTPVMWPNYDFLLFQAGANDDDPDTIVCLFEGGS